MPVVSKQRLVERRRPSGPPPWEGLERPYDEDEQTGMPRFLVRRLWPGNRVKEEAVHLTAKD